MLNSKARENVTRGEKIVIVNGEGRILTNTKNIMIKRRELSRAVHTNEHSRKCPVGFIAIPSSTLITMRGSSSFRGPGQGDFLILRSFSMSYNPH